MHVAASSKQSVGTSAFTLIGDVVDTRRRPTARPPGYAIGNDPPRASVFYRSISEEEHFMDGIIYLVGLIVIVMAILSFLGLR